MSLTAKQQADLYARVQATDLRMVEQQKRMAEAEGRIRAIDLRMVEQQARMAEAMTELDEALDKLQAIIDKLGK